MNMVASLVAPTLVLPTSIVSRSPTRLDGLTMLGATEELPQMFRERWRPENEAKVAEPEDEACVLMEVIQNTDSEYYCGVLSYDSTDDGMVGATRVQRCASPCDRDSHPCFVLPRCTGVRRRQWQVGLRRVSRKRL